VVKGKQALHHNDVWEQVRSYITTITTTATTSVPHDKYNKDHDPRKYYFGIVESTWTSFLQPYDLPRHGDDRPIYFMIWQGMYWHDASYTTLSSFVDAFESHRIIPQRPRPTITGERGLHWTAELFLNYYPLSLGMVLMFLASIVVWCTKDPSTAGTSHQQNCQAGEFSVVDTALRQGDPCREIHPKNIAIKKKD
jgi:hypothetical protein